MDQATLDEVGAQGDDAGAVGCDEAATSNPSGTKADFESTTEKPRPLPVNPDGIPEELKAGQQWVCWRLEWRVSKKDKGKWNKVPTDPKTGNNAKADGDKSPEKSAAARATWGTFEQAYSRHRKYPEVEVGIGFQFAADDPFAGVDLDDAVDPTTNDLKPWAAAIVKDFNTFTEVSPSGTGVKLYLRGKKPGTECKKAYHSGVIEMYDHGRFFAMTGKQWPGTPSTVESRQEQLEALYGKVFGNEKPKPPEHERNGSAAPETDRPKPQQDEHQSPPPELTDEEILALLGRASNRAKFNALMNGSVSDYNGDESRADSALCWLIAFYTKRFAQIERIFGRSTLAEREKWKDRAEYHKWTIDKAIAGVTEHYTPPGPKIKFTRKGRQPGQDDHDQPAGEQATDGTTPPPGPAPSPDPGPGRQANRFALGPLTLIPGPARRTPSGKVSVSVKVSKGGEIVLEFPVTSASSSWKNPTRQLLQLITEDAPAGEPTKPEEVERLFMKIVADAGRRADAPPVSEGPTVAEIVRSKAPLMWQLVCRTDKGAWSEAKPGELSRSEFVNGTTEELMEECAKAADAPRQANGQAVRHDLLRMVQAELGITWASILATLPTQRDVDLAADTAAGRRFRSEMIRLWTTPGTWEIPKKADGKPSDHIGATKASLVSRLQTQHKKWLQSGAVPADREPWRKIHPALSAWWRVGELHGEIKVYLAMRWELGPQVRQELTAVTDQDSLTRLGKQFGMLSDGTPVPDRTGGSTPNETQKRLAILSDALTEELLSNPADDLNEGGDDDGQA